MAALPITLYLTIFSLLIALAISVPAGTIAGLRRNSWLDVGFTTWAFLGVSIPGFWLAIVFVYVFGVLLGWVPLQGYISLREDPVESLKTMVLPALTLGVLLSGPLTRYLRSSILQTLSQEFVLVAHAKGLSERHCWSHPAQLADPLRHRAGGPVQLSHWRCGHRRECLRPAWHRRPGRERD